MKKSYVKPELFYESFVLSQSIAACGIDVNNEDQYNCARLDEQFWPGLGGMRIFESGYDCDLDFSDLDVYCYTVGTSEAGKLFNS